MSQLQVAKSVAAMAAMVPTALTSLVSHACRSINLFLARAHAQLSKLSHLVLCVATVCVWVHH